MSNTKLFFKKEERTVLFSDIEIGDGFIFASNSGNCERIFVKAYFDKHYEEYNAFAISDDYAEATKIDDNDKVVPVTIEIRIYDYVK